MKIGKIAVAAIAMVSMLSLSACGSGSSKQAGGDGKADSFTGRGPITYVQGKDNSGKLQGLLDQWNKEHPDQKVTMIELSTSADQQRQSMVQNFQTKSDAYCVLSVDNINVPEFAAHRWIMQLPEDQFPKNEIMPAVWKTGVYRGKLYAMAHSSDGGILYYRKDLLEKAGIKEPPKTWDDMSSDCEKVKKLPGYENIGCYAGQFAKYEGLTVNIDEAIHTAGGQLVDDQGKVVADSPQAVAGIKKVVDAFKDGMIPKEALTYKEEEGRSAFENNRLVFYRNWPYQYSITEKTMKGKFDIAPLPGFTADKPGASSLGGHNAAISSYCKNKATALDFVKWYTSKKSVDFMLKEMSLAPTYTSLYDDPENIKKYPYLPVLKKSIEQAAPRPQVVNYGDVTAAIQDAIFPALQGKTSAEDAAKQLQTKLSELIKK